MKKILSTLAVCLGVCLLAAVPAGAGPYFGASLGQASADLGDLGPDTTVDDTDTEWKIYGGWRLFKFVALEAGFSDMGEVSAASTIDTSSVSMSADGITVAALGVLPVGNFDLFAKMGYLYWDADLAINDPLLGPINTSDDGDDTILGAGVVWNYPGPGAARLEYEKAELGGLDIDSISAGLTFMF